MPWLCDDSTERAFVVRHAPREPEPDKASLPGQASFLLLHFRDSGGRLTYSHHVRKAVVILLDMSATVRWPRRPHYIIYLLIGLECRRLGTQIFYSQIH